MCRASTGPLPFLISANSQAMLHAKTQDCDEPTARIVSPILTKVLLVEIAGSVSMMQHKTPDLKSSRR
jgi:hypothetical protein